MNERIFINALSALQGGGQTYLLNLLDIDDLRKNFDVFIIVSDKNKDVFKSIPNISIYETSFAGKNLINRFLWENVTLPILLKIKKVDYLFSVSGILPKFYIPGNCKKITICQNMLPFCPTELARIKSFKQRMKFHLIKLSQWFSFLRSDVIIFISEFGKETITNLLMLKNKKNVVIPHGINDMFRVGERKIINNSKTSYTLYVSSFFEYKAQLELVQGWGLLSAQVRKNRKLILVGPGSPGYRKEVQEKVFELGLGHEVEVLHEVNYRELPNLYQNAELLVFASSCENCPNILLECLASGVLTICSRFPPMPEFALDSVIYMDPYDVEEIKRVLENFYLGKIEEEVYIRKALEISAKYTWQSTTKKTWDCFRKINS